MVACMVAAVAVSGSEISIALFMFAGYDSLGARRYPNLAVKLNFLHIRYGGKAFTAEYAEIAEKELSFFACTRLGG